VSVRTGLVVGKTACSSCAEEAAWQAGRSEPIRLAERRSAPWRLGPWRVGGRLDIARATSRSRNYATPNLASRLAEAGPAL
jgi:hypothetical protein